MEKIPVIQETEETSESETKIMNLSETYWRDYLKEQNYNKDINEMCSLCIKEQIEKYGKQTIPCSGLNSAKEKMSDELYKQIVSTLSEHEIKEMNSLFDPYTYMEVFLDANVPAKENGDNPLEDRWYQKLISGCSAQSKVVRLGRRCLPGYEKILQSDGIYQNIEDIEIGTSVVSYRDGKTVHNKVIDKWSNGIKPVYRIKLVDGKTVDCTSNHPLLVKTKEGTEWKTIEKGLSIKDEIITLTEYDVFGDYSDIEEAKLLGYLLADGYIPNSSKQTPKFTSCTLEYIEEVKNIVFKKFSYNCNIRKRKESEAYDLYFTDGNHGTKNIVKEWLHENNLLGVKTKNEKFMKHISKYDKESFGYFLNRLWSGDGCVSLWERKDRVNSGLAVELGLTTSNKCLVDTLKTILYKLGINSNITIERRKSPSSDNVGTYYKLRIGNGDSVKRFLELTGPVFGKEENSIRALKELEKRTRNTLKTPDSLYFPRRVKSIELLGDMETFDITVENDHNFIINNIVTHNSGKTYMMALMMIHEMLLTPKYKVLLVSPYAVQTEEVVSTFKNLCSRLPENPIIKAKQSPIHIIEFSNGSILKGFTAATNADSVRGQTGHRIVLDECLIGSTQILMSNGDTKSIEDLKIGDMVMSEVDGVIETHPIIDHAMTGSKPVYKYLFEQGYELIATENHPVFTSEGEKPISEAKDIKIAMFKNTYAKLEEVTYIGEKPVYNMTIARSHNYIANGLLTHNCDDIPENAIISIMAIRMSVPDVKVWRSGTPKGERNLYKSEQDPQNKCFHYPSFVIPHYDDKLDASLRHEMGDGIGYVQEVMAIMGLASNSVFQSMFINRAQNKSLRITAKDVMSDRSRFIVFIGVDWNHDQVGSRLLVIAYDKITPQFHIIEKERVAIEGFTQYAAVERIIKLNRKYNCDHVFVDQGFGAKQISDLKMFALAQVGIVPKGHADLKLLDVTPIDYGSFTEVRDPITGDVYKTPTKQMAVMNAVEVFEKDYITLDSKDDHEIILQLKNYIEKSRNKGRIVYSYISKKIGDHDLDALMIGLFGMKKLYSSLFVGESTQALLKLVSLKEDGEPDREITNLDQYECIVGYSFGRKSKLFSNPRDKKERTYERNTGRRTGRGSF